MAVLLWIGFTTAHVLHVNLAVSLQVHLPPIHTYRIVSRNSKYQPFLQMSELPVRRCGTVGSSTA